MKVLFICVLGVLLSEAVAVESCSRGCSHALASYYFSAFSTDDLISQVMSTNVSQILLYNPQITDPNFIITGNLINVPFSCDCIGGQFLGHVFNFSSSSGINYTSIAENYYSNLTTVSALSMYNTYGGFSIPDTGGSLNVTVNCSCGDAAVSRRYGLFITYPLRPGDTLRSVAAANNLSTEVVRNYNPTVNFSAGSGIVFIPGRDRNGKFPALNGGGLPLGAIVGVSAAVFCLVLFVATVLFVKIQKKRAKHSVDCLQTHHGNFWECFIFLVCIHVAATGFEFSGRQLAFSGGRDTSGSQDGTTPPGVMHVSLQKSLEFSYEELATATDNFSIEYKIGEGGFAAVYYAELRGEKLAIKKMDMNASKEFFAELKVMSHVHHRNLVRLIGYCVQGSLFLVYEYMENGNLSQHLRGKEPLSWSTRVQIALDSARGLEYIHEHTVPVFVHRDVKPSNILLDKNFNAKIADFGLAKLAEFGHTPISTGGLVGTFGYMPPEYLYGDVSPKVDVYAFGVVLYELISAKEVMVNPSNSTYEARSLVALFEEALNSDNPREELHKLVDQGLDNYSLDSVHKMAQLASACTLDNPRQRPTMRSVVVSLMTLSTST